MLLPLASLAAAVAVLTSPLVAALSATDIPADLPVAQLVKTANAQLAAGNALDALTYFDVAITRDPKNYLTIFKRGAAYLSLGKSTQAHKDFDRVLKLKPDFEGALIQRAKIQARSGKWAAAEKDYKAAGKNKDSPEVQELHEAEGAARLAHEANANGNWEDCIQHASIAIMTAGGLLDLRMLRSHCRFERREIAEGVSDLQHAVQISSGSTEPHMRISALLFYALGETEQGLMQMRKCLQSDPDSKACRKLFRREKELDKSIKKVREASENHKYAGAVKLLIQRGEEAGILQEVKDDFEQHKKEGLIHENSPNGLYAKMVETTCEAYMEMNNHKRGIPYCEETLALNPTSLPGLLSKAQQQINNEEFEPAIATLNAAKETHGNKNEIQKLLNEAHTLLKRSKQKDYYKVIGVPRDADERDIKKAFRKLTLKFHPDKAAAQGMPKDEAEKKMAAINEAYEVLSDPELKARFDRGDDPNAPQGGQPFQGSPFGGQQFVFRQGGFPGGSFQFQGFQGGGFPFGG